MNAKHCHLMILQRVSGLLESALIKRKGSQHHFGCTAEEKPTPWLARRTHGVCQGLAGAVPSGGPLDGLGFDASGLLCQG